MRADDPTTLAIPENFAQKARFTSRPIWFYPVSVRVLPDRNQETLTWRQAL
jgi:hypothetical protein